MSAVQFKRVDVSSWRVRDEEPAGGDEKRWLTDGDGSDWLFKPVTRHPGVVQGEDWSEKVSAELGALLGVPCARVELAERKGCPGSISLDLKPANWELQHGAVLLARTLEDYAPRDRDRRGHSLANIERALEPYGPPLRAEVPEDFQAFDVFAGYLVLDAWIANRDRHDENWAVLQPQLENRETALAGALAGSYDHATSLGFNLSDADRDRMVADDAVTAWARRGNAYRFERPSRPERIPTLVEFAATALSMRPPSVRSYWRARLRSVEDGAARELVARIPGMSQSACTFVVELTSINRERLLEALDA